jgi:hypothetical protein
MVIHCTKKLIEAIKITPEETTDKPLFSWHANLISINRKKTLVLENDLTRYPVVLYGLKAKEFKDIENVILTAIKETMLAENISSEVIDAFIEAGDSISFAKAYDRRKISFVNQTCQNVSFFEEDLRPDIQNQTFLTRKLGSMIAYDENKNTYRINEYMYKELEAVTKLPVFVCKAVQIKVTLKVGDYISWRKLLIPHNSTFPFLHKTLQEMFAWNDTHLHEFIIYNGDLPLARIVQSLEVFDYPTKILLILEHDVKISEYMPKYKKIIYRYDMGDNWEHIIEVEDLIFNYDKNYPTCIEGEGDSPPEDVGGETGFLEFQNIIKDPSHEQHVDIMEWAHMQRYQLFDINKINMRLKNIY